MPTNRRRRARGRNVLTLDHLTFAEEFAFVAGWYPAVVVDGYYQPAKPDSWKTWGEFFSDYALVREELIAAYGATYPHMGEPWAEKPYQTWRAHGIVPDPPHIIGPLSVEYAHMERTGAR